MVRLTRLLITTALLLTTVACGKMSDPSQAFQAASDECQGAAIPNRFMVKYLDGRSEVVLAPSKEEFIAGFLSENLDQIAFAEHDYRVQLKNAEVQPFLNRDTVNNWGTVKINAQAVWRQGFRGANAAVAVIDSGMDLSHAQLRKRVFTNDGELGVDPQTGDRSTNGIDDDKNGFIDDAMGYDFVADAALTGDYNYHGSHVAGIVAAEHTDATAAPATYVQGVAPAAKILPLAFLDANGSGRLSDGVRAIQYAVSRGVQVINASWGGSECSRSLAEAIAGLEARGIVFVAAAGNDRRNIDQVREYPASLDLPAQITVGATGENDYMADYSNYGSQNVHIFAPGTAIVSTIPGGIAALSGTSMAAPFVSGALALLKGAYPNASPQQLRDALYASATRYDDYLNASRGRLDLLQALNELRRLLGAP